MSNNSNTFSGMVEYGSNVSASQCEFMLKSKSGEGKTREGKKGRAGVTSSQLRARQIETNERFSYWKEPEKHVKHYE